MSAGQPEAPEPVTPDPLREEPPADRFCDLILNGGVASGVVYPWALVELARHYRFKSIGGNSVGAMAAAVAAAGEYGRCIGIAGSFEPLRRFPMKLAEQEQPDGDTKMLRLFQPSKPVGRLFRLFLAVVHLNNPKPKEDDREPTAWFSRLYRAIVHAISLKPKQDDQQSIDRLTLWGLLHEVLKAYRVYWLVLPLGLAIAIVLHTHGYWAVAALVLGGASAFLITLAIVAIFFYCDLKALAENDYGLCTGRGQGDGEEGLVEWLHKGIQIAAGRDEHDPPLTFADLWAAPRFGQQGPTPLPGGLQPLDAGVDLQMFASNITLGRPMRLPLNDPNTRLFYHPKEWERYFPDYVMRALEQASRPYAPAAPGDPDSAAAGLDPATADLMACVRELPSGGMPIVVAARLSLCFPLLFSLVGVYAIDNEQLPEKNEQRKLRRCLLSDGGLCSNFPIHLFDAAHPRWPTFAFRLDSRLKHQDAVSRLMNHLEGREDNWLRFVPGARDDEPPRGLLRRLGGLSLGIVVTMKDWNDRVTGRLPQMRNRIIRLALQPGEGQLNLDMLPETIRRMADEYGTAAGKRLVDAFVPGQGQATTAWREHLYVRSMIELHSLHQHLCNYGRAVNSGGSTTMPLGELLDEATRTPPLHSDRPDPTAARLTSAQRAALDRAVKAVEALEAELSACQREFGPYVPDVEPELHLRPPL